MKLPVDFENRMKEYLGEEYEAFIASYDKPEIKGVRFNELVGCADGYDILNRMYSENNSTDLHENSFFHKIPWMDNAYCYELMSEDRSDSKDGESLKFRPGKHPYHEAGVFYMQEPSAMVPVAYLDVKPFDRVLDLCAAPGGKSTQIAACLKGEGILVSNEIMPDRARILSENIERMGVRNALVVSEDPRNISDRFAGFFDKILVDAPCSGEGMFRRSETAVNEWSLENVKICADRQEWILDEAVKMLAPGGRLVYSTCTFAKEEDEIQAEALLQRHSDMSYEPMKLFEGMREGFNGIGIRLFPHLIKGEGHYVCSFRKKGECVTKVPPVCGYEPEITKKDKEELKEMYEFIDSYFAANKLSRLSDGDLSTDKHTRSLSVEIKSASDDMNNISDDNHSASDGTNNLSDDNNSISDSKNNFSDEKIRTSFKSYFDERRVIRFKDQIYLAPKECPMLKGIRVLRPGLHLGTVLKNRFEPGHALAMAISRLEAGNACILSAKEQEVYKYYRGETFNVNASMLEILSTQDNKDAKNTVKKGNKLKNDQNSQYKKNKSGSAGWFIVFVDDFSIGWGKLTGEIMKNHYPKGLRKNLT